ncbi:hypothetical protein F5X71_34860 [Nocardia brasiliensis]|uniref:tRNA/rRNA methyltransferase SpoU type domain-containing protein n=2 Tax=Nocardia brasiliensis TaxID=37326 RepID=A0A6G9Y3X6_NOCBR|nr:hypothetical protein F5X71_34860 [Nocardia brasiliensis]
MSIRGYYGIGIWHPKRAANVGGLWRSAMSYDAALIATVGRRYATQASDTCATPKSVPLHHYSDIDDLVGHLPHSCPLVAVELDSRAESLTAFAHPARAMYLLGAEDHGLPASVLDRCHRIVTVPTPAPWSLNVAVAGTLVMHDRYLKRLRLPVPE